MVCLTSSPLWSWICHFLPYNGLPSCWWCSRHDSIHAPVVSCRPACSSGHGGRRAQSCNAMVQEASRSDHGADRLRPVGARNGAAGSHTGGAAPASCRGFHRHPGASHALAACCSAPKSCSTFHVHQSSMMLRPASGVCTAGCHGPSTFPLRRMKLLTFAPRTSHTLQNLPCILPTL